MSPHPRPDFEATVPVDRAAKTADIHDWPGEPLRRAQGWKQQIDRAAEHQERMHRQARDRTGRVVDRVILAIAVVCIGLSALGVFSDPEQPAPKTRPVSCAPKGCL